MLLGVGPQYGDELSLPESNQKVQKMIVLIHEGDG